MSLHLVTRRVEQPAAGHDFTFVPSYEQHTKLLTVYGQFVTSATVASRSVAISLKDQDTLEWWSADLAATQAASLTAHYAWAHNTAIGANANIVAGERGSGPLPALWLNPGDSVSSVTLNIDAADQWSNVVARFLACNDWQELQTLERLRAALGG